MNLNYSRSKCPRFLYRYDEDDTKWWWTISNNHKDNATSRNHDSDSIYIYNSLYQYDHIIFNITSNLTLSDINNSLINYLVINFTSLNFQGSNIPAWSKQNVNPIPSGHLVLIEFSIRLKNIYTSRLFSIDAHETEAYVDVEIKEMSPLLNSPHTIILMKPKDHIIYYEEYQSNIITFITNIGGFYTFTTTVYIFLFGSPKLSPWGYCQTCPCWWKLRRNYKRHLARKYIYKDGKTLFVNGLHESLVGSSIEDRINVMADRIVMLEDLLMNHYLNTSYLEVLKKTRERYISLYKDYLINENGDIDNLDNEDEE
ncbi:22057_t:CDS:2 [Dentiscutata erythropus]|uniref:22057_t:CDS:1 n=1 Tax=Dentiscutata erythropus TaxID=1348616 RepID=A0A9N8W917_9GLOM|nr:22057_t:CDS:2 [Dentiscutata erythropus]